MTANATILGPAADTAPARLRRKAAKLVLPALGLLVAAFVAAGFSFGVYLPNLHNGLIAATFAVVGLFVLARRPGNREGWLFVATGVASAVMFFCRQTGLAEVTSGTAEPGPAVIWATWFGVWPLPLVLVLAGVTMMAFPDGRLPSRRWRLVVLAMTVAGAVLAFASALWPVDYAENALAVPPPFHVAGYGTVQALWNVASPACFGLFQVAWVTAVVLRLRRARGNEARQLRWFAYAVAMGAIAMVVGAVAFGTVIVGVLAVPVVAIAAGAAIVKYRLYDIDPVINKTLVFGAMATLVTVGYVGVVAVVGWFVGMSAARHPVASVVATAVVAVAFDPVRRSVQAWADALVYGRRPTPYETLARLSTQLDGDPPDGDLFAGLAAAVADGVGAVEVTLWVGPADRLVAVAAWPPGQPMPAAPRDLASIDEGGMAMVIPIAHQGRIRGAVTLTKAPGDVLTPTEAKLLRDLAAQLGLMLDNVDLGLELQQRLHQLSAQAVELQAAAKRIVAAQYEARRTLERDLHDGAQQRLVTLALRLRGLSERAVAGGDPGLSEEADHARRELAQALAELRELARGIHPAILTQEGLDAAVGFLAERAPIPVRLDLRVESRLGQDIEATAYFAVSEALTNAAKHSDATRIDVTGRHEHGWLRIEVADDGRGGADGRWGHGLQGLVDRLAALNGRVTVHSPAGGGTRLIVEVPCG